jgi:hypothetical protein
MAAAATAGGGADLSAAFETALQGAQEAQQQELAFNEALNAQKAEFQAESSRLAFEDAMATKMANLASAQAQALAQ